MSAIPTWVEIVAPVVAMLGAIGVFGALLNWLYDEVRVRPPRRKRHGVVEPVHQNHRIVGLTVTDVTEQKGGLALPATPSRRIILP